MECIFISPHLDDAILSCGALIYALAKKDQVSVISIFTESKKDIFNPAANNLLKSSGYADANRLFADRKSEDKKVAESLKVNFVHLDFIDAAWRQVYKSEKEIFSGEVKDIKSESNLKKSIKIALKRRAGKSDIVIFCPLGIGGHVDHVITRDICQSIFPNLIYWEDVPYNLHEHASIDFVNRNKLSKFSFRKNLFWKEKLIKNYQSQIAGIFDSRPMILRKENYYY